MEYEEIFFKESTIQKKKCLLISMSLVFKFDFIMERYQENTGNMKQEKVIATHTSDKGRVCTIHKEAQQKKKKRTNTLEEKVQKQQQCKRQFTEESI